MAYYFLGAWLGYLFLTHVLFSVNVMENWPGFVLATPSILAAVAFFLRAALIDSFSWEKFRFFLLGMSIVVGVVPPLLAGWEFYWFFLPFAIGIVVHLVDEWVAYWFGAV